MVKNPFRDRSEPTSPDVPGSIGGWVLLLVAAFILSSCGGASVTHTPLPSAGLNYPNERLLVDVNWLQTNMAEPGLRILDVRSAEAYQQGHVPGAVNLLVGEISSTVDGIPMEFDRGEVQDALNRSGVEPESTVVIYDNLGMMNAARLFWTLEYVGHSDARVLDGGWNAWVQAEAEVSAEVPRVESTDYPIQLDSAKIVSAESVLDRLADPEVVILDARSPEEYTGEVKLAERGGHIPGAVNLVWLDALQGGDAVYTIEPGWQEELEDEDVEALKPADEIQALLEARGIAPEKQVITYCQTLWRGAHVYFLLRLTGFDGVRGYDGSWAEWGNRADLPVETGGGPGVEG